MRNDYDVELHKNYAEGRAFTRDTERFWRAIIARHLTPGETVLDLGCGTGRFTGLLAGVAGRPVLGMDVSRQMLMQAGAGWLARAEAERLPLRSACIDFAFLSMVTHHFSDLGAACRELARVLRPEGRAFLRTSYGGRLDDVCFYRFFPAAKRIDDKRLPSSHTIEAAFAVAGLACVHHERVRQVIDEDLAAHRKRLAARAISTLEFLTEAELREGFDAMAAAAGKETAPVLDPIEVAVFMRRA